MKFALEIYAEKPLCIKFNTYFKTALAVKGEIIADSAGLDSYSFLSVITSDKRVAGLGRDYTYSLSSLPAGLGPVEARPGKYMDLALDREMELVLETNLILDPGILADSLGVRLINEQGKQFDVPFSRPDVSIHWESRGRYIIPLSAFLCSRLFRAVS
jgi:hypothetical protein